MKPVNKSIYLKRRGAVLIISMIFVLIFAALAVSMASLSGVNVQIADNQRKVNSALSAAQSGLQAGCYLANKYSSSGEALQTSHLLNQADKNTTWNYFCNYLQTQTLPVGGVTWSITDSNELSSSDISFGNGSKTSLRFNYDGNSISLQSTGRIPPFGNPITKKVSMAVEIKRNNDVLKYAIASQGRMWLTGNTTVYGDVYSKWDRPEISPYNMTYDSRVEGTINTILTREAIEAHHSGYPDYQLETLNANGEPIDVNGDPLGTNYEARYYGPDDQIQAYHEGINYGQPNQDIPGMDISDYDTTSYNSGLTLIAPSTLPKVREYFPHAVGNYNYPRDGTPSFTPNRRLDRYVYENRTFDNERLPANYNALFRNCTFNNILYVDCAKNGSTYYNNVRFENCTFNGVITTNVPQLFKWQHNCLYFTGEATFDNQSGVQEATILAPHFNVNLGNTNPQQSDNNILTGAIVGGIVDVRGNAQIYGTIISMCDTTQWDEGYVTNIGATLDDGGSETTELGDVGVISITPEEDKMLPSGITSPVIIKPLQNTYSEGV